MGWRSTLSEFHIPDGALRARILSRECFRCRGPSFLSFSILPALLGKERERNREREKEKIKENQNNHTYVYLNMQISVPSASHPLQTTSDLCILALVSVDPSSSSLVFPFQIGLPVSISVNQQQPLTASNNPTTARSGGILIY